MERVSVIFRRGKRGREEARPAVVKLYFCVNICVLSAELFEDPKKY